MKNRPLTPGQQRRLYIALIGMWLYGVFVGVCAGFSIWGEP